MSEWTGMKKELKTLSNFAACGELRYDKEGAPRVSNYP
jgi:hypothetical protein